MNLLFKLLLIVIASAAGAIGHYARAPLGDSNSRPHVWVPRLAQAPALMPAPLGAPVYVASSPAGADSGLASSPAASLLLGGDAAPETVQASTLTPASPSGHRPIGPIPSSAVSGVPDAAIAVAYAVRVPAVAGGAADALPEPAPSGPSGWTLLLSSFVVVGFIARRRSRLVAG